MKSIKKYIVRMMGSILTIIVVSLGIYIYGFSEEIRIDVCSGKSDRVFEVLSLPIYTVSEDDGIEAEVNRMKMGMAGSRILKIPLERNDLIRTSYSSKEKDLYLDLKGKIKLKSVLDKSEFDKEVADSVRRLRSINIE